MSKLKVSTISDPDNDNTAITVSNTGAVTFAQPINGDGSNLTGLSSGSLTKVASYSVSTSVASIDFDSVFDSTYRDYYIVASGIWLDTAGANLYVRWRKSGASLTSSYYWSLSGAESDWSNTQIGNVGGDGWSENQIVMLPASVVNDTNTSYQGKIYAEITAFAPYEVNSYPVLTGRVGAKADAGSSGVGHGTFFSLNDGGTPTTDRIDGIQFLASSGNIKGGDVVIYGLEK